MNSTVLVCDVVFARVRLSVHSGNITSVSDALRYISVYVDNIPPDQVLTLTTHLAVVLAAPCFGHYARLRNVASLWSNELVNRDVRSEIRSLYHG